MANHARIPETKENRSKSCLQSKSNRSWKPTFHTNLSIENNDLGETLRECGVPDIAIKKYIVVIFIDSCFWNFCPIHEKVPERNQENDAETTQYFVKKTGLF